MKRFVSVMLCISLMASLVSCGKTPTKESSSSSSEDSTRETEESEETTETSSDTVTGDPVIFSTVDRDGNTYDESIFSDYELTVINFWEPWCGPCVGEMPDIEKLYENYSDKGVLVIGVYSEDNMEEDVDAVLSESGITYPILRYTADFDQYQSGYVPTTILVDSNGNIIDTGEVYLDGADSTLIVGANSYSEWKDLVNRYLGA